jgi:dTDP-4-dehydrorhamnose reductase
VYSQYGHNFVKTMLHLMQVKSELGVVADQIGSPTWANGLARTIWAFAGCPESQGTYHWSDSGVASWYDFAVAIQREGLATGLLKQAIPIKPITTEDYPTPAVRPAYSVLKCSKTRKLLGIDGEHWQTALQAMIKGLAAQ